MNIIDRRSIGCLTAICLLILLLPFWTHALASVKEQKETINQNNVRVFKQGNLSSSADNQSQLVTLPHSSFGQKSLYIFEFEKFIETPLWGVYLDSRKYNIKVYVNQQLVGGGEQLHFSEANWNSPAMASFPELMLKSGANTLTIEVTGPGTDTSLGKVFIGDYAEIRALFKSRYFKVVVVQYLIIALTLMAGAVSFVLWLIRRKDFAYFWFAGGTLAWALHNIVKMTPVPVYMDFTAFQVVGNSALIWFSFFGILFIRNITQKRCLKTSIALWLIHISFQIFFLIGMICFPVFYKNVGGPILMVYNLLLGLWSAILVLSNWSLSNTFKMLGSAIILVVLMGINDTLNYFGVINSLYSLQFSAPFLIGVFLLSLLIRYVESVSTRERIYAGYGIKDSNNLVLQDEVDWTELQQKDREKAAEKERQKFRRDLHDGVTGSLISVITSLEAKKEDNQSILLPLQQSMAELRHIIDARGFEHNELNSLVGSFRQFIQKQLDILNIDLKWEVLQLDDNIPLSEEQAHNLFRILQEAFTNAIKHSGASFIRFTAKSFETGGDSKTVELCIEDNGIGPGSSGVDGKGLSNMKTRAREIGATLSVNDVGGTQVIVTLTL